MLRREILYFIAVPLYLIVLVVSIRKRFSLQKHLVVLMLLVYCLGVISVTLFPLPVQKSVLESRRSPDDSNPHHNFVPIVDMVKVARGGNFRTFARVIGGNVLLFVPLGVLLPVLNRKFNSLSHILLSGLLGSVAIEGSQLLISLVLGFNYRTFDVDDIILNTLGTVVGFCLLQLARPLWGRLQNTFKEQEDARVG